MYNIHTKGHDVLTRYDVEEECMKREKKRVLKQGTHIHLLCVSVCSNPSH